jgi:hypothetical protein
MKSIVFYIYINLFIILNQPYLLLISSTTVLLNANISLQYSNTLTVDVLKPTVNTSFYNITYYGLVTHIPYTAQIQQILDGRTVMKMNIFAILDVIMILNVSLKLRKTL